MSRSNVAQRLDLAVTRAGAKQPSLLKKRVSPHVLRHTSAMHLLQSGVPFNVIACGSDMRARPLRTAMSRPTSP